MFNYKCSDTTKKSPLKKTSLKYLKHLHLSRKQAAHPKFLKATHQLKTEPMVNIIDSKKMNNFVIWWTEVSFLLPKSKVNRFEIMRDRAVFLLTELSFFFGRNRSVFYRVFFFLFFQARAIFVGAFFLPFLFFYGLSIIWPRSPLKVNSPQSVFI